MADTYLEEAIAAAEKAIYDRGDIHPDGYDMRLVTPADAEYVVAAIRPHLEAHYREKLEARLTSDEAIEIAARWWAATMVERPLWKKTPPPELAAAREGVKAAFARAVHLLSEEQPESPTDPPSPPDAPSVGDQCADETRCWKIDDDRTLRVIKPDGTILTFDDYLYEGDLVGMGEVPEASEDRDGRPPYGRVVRFSDGLWVVPNTPEQERERTQAILDAAALKPDHTKTDERSSKEGI